MRTWAFPFSSTTKTEKLSPLLINAGSGITIAASRSCSVRSRLANMPPRSLASAFGIRAFTSAVRRLSSIWGEMK